MKKLMPVLLAFALPMLGQHWSPAISANPLPHFEIVGGKRVFFVDRRPFTILTVETHWDELIYGRYAETMRTYDYMYAAANSMGLNALKVPIKWSMVEPSEGVYNFSYVDHVLQEAEANHLKLVLGWFGHYASGDGTLYRNFTGEVFAPMYIIENVQRFPRALDADGKPHRNAASYDYPAIVEHEAAALRAFMQHLRQVDSKRTVLMIQVENEIAVFGAGANGGERHDPRLWRDHSPASNQKFSKWGSQSDLAYSARSLATSWLRPVTQAGANAYSIPLFCNFVNGSLAEGMLGGSPGEDVATYLDRIPALSFIGVNYYPTWGNETPAPVSVPASAARSTLDRYRVGRNIPAFTETNSDDDPLAPRLVFISVGEYGSPLFSPWALGTSCPITGEPYVEKDGTLANGAFTLRQAYTAIAKCTACIAQLGGTQRARVFLAELPGHRFSDTKDVAGIPVTISGVNNGQAIAMHPAENEMLVLGFRCAVEMKVPVGSGPPKVERGSYDRDAWKPEGPVIASIVGGVIRLQLTGPQAVRISW